MDEAVKRVAFCTFGCRLNQYDTETVRTLLERDGTFASVSPLEQADVFVVNTCSVTARADATARKSIRRIHSQHPQAKIVVTGCYAQRAPQELAALPGVSLVLGAPDRGRVAEEVKTLAPDRARIAVSPISEAKTFLDVPIAEMLDRSRAFVKVQEGCNESCTFCIIPQTRGRSRSRGPEHVLQQVEKLVRGGYPEIVLTGVHLGDYGLDLADGRRLLTDLIGQILRIPGVRRFRLSSIEPASVSSELIELMASEERFARHFHIPMQSGSNAVLGRMKRGYDVEAFAELMLHIADTIPECGIGTDVICGFPGETESDFQQTFDRLVALPITYIHPFTYSARPGSAAEKYGDDVPPEVKKRRTRSLKRLSHAKTRAFSEIHVGRVMPVLFEEGSCRGDGNASGWTDNYLRINLKNGKPRDVLDRVQITHLTDTELAGELAAEA